MTLRIPLQRLPHGEGMDLPAYVTAQAAAMDLMAAVTKDVVINPMQRALIPTGIAIAIPPGYEAQIRARSSLPWKYGVIVMNGPGTIDADYRGEIFVTLGNLDDQPFTVTRGMRIAQMVIAPCLQIAWDVVEKLPETERGRGGFGSTGLGGVKNK